MFEITDITTGATVKRDSAYGAAEAANWIRVLAGLTGHGADGLENQARQLARMEVGDGITHAGLSGSSPFDYARIERIG